MPHPAVHVPSGANFIARDLIHLVMHWGARTRGTGGYTYDAIQILEGRWQVKHQLMQGGEGETAVSKARVILTGEAETGGWLRLVPAEEEDNVQNLRAWLETTPTDPADVIEFQELQTYYEDPTEQCDPRAFRIIQYDQIPDLRGMNIMHRAFI